MNTLSDSADQHRNYDLGYKILHWLMAAMLIFMVVAGQGFGSVVSEADHLVMLTGHSSFGVVITLLLIIRLSKRFIFKSPVPNQQLTGWNQALSKTIQYGIYIALITVPATGMLTARSHELSVTPFGLINVSQSATSGFNQGQFELLRLMHETSLKVLVVLVLVHVAGAMYHRLIRKDAVLASMTISNKVTNK